MAAAVIFDLNGVLITSELLSDRFAREFGVPSDTFIAALSGVMEVVRKPDAPGVYTLFKPHLDTWNVQLDEEAFLDFWFSGESVDRDALALVDELRALGTHVFILSNNFKERTTYYRTHFPEIFSAITKAYFSWETGNVKPGKEALQQVLNEHGLEAREVTYFDDSEKCITLAKEIGIDAMKWQGSAQARDYLKKLN